MTHEDETQGERAFRYLSETLEECKLARPGDRSMRDRAFAVVITDLERIVAYYDYWVNNDHFE